MIVNLVGFQCDECETMTEFKTSFPEAVQELKDSGWNSIKKSEKDWTHLCPEHR